ncbi:MAG TPA: HEAT repeat domain-containing protein [Acidobacteriaceae bacterium]|nr:HEAT repeat domain-containing protein [Acidobacteriaceae bacterium]
MNCEQAAQHIILVTYGELADDRIATLERHLAECEACNRELKALLAMHEALAYRPVMEPSPNLVAQSRMRLDEELDGMPAHGFLTRLRVNLFAWLCHVQSAPALVTLLLGVGFLAGDFTYRYQVAHQPVRQGAVQFENTTNGTIADVSSIVQTPNTHQVQVSYNRIIPETIQGSLDDPQIWKILVIGMKQAANSGVRSDSVALLANECRIGHQCNGGQDSSVRNGLLVSLRYDKNPNVRLAALEGLQPYVAEDQRVRDGVLDALAHDSSERVRTRAISLLQPVESDSSVRQVMRTVSTTDENPYIRTVSTHALAGTADIQ